MAGWGNRYSKCTSCSTEDWRHKAKGLCVKCYPIIRSIEIVSKWDFNEKSTLKPIPGISAIVISQIASGRDFEKSKTEILRQLENRLNLYKNCFNPECISGINMERLLEKFSELILGDKGKKMFHGVCSTYDSNFQKEQLEIIYKDLSLILASKRFELNLTKILLLR